MKAFDFQGHFYWKDTLRVFERLAPYGVEVIESVSWSEDYEGMAEVRRRVPVAVSEHISSYAQAMRMIKAGAVDIFNMTHQSGGMWGAARLFALADAAGLQCLISTTQEMSIGTAAVAHLGATVPVLHYPGRRGRAAAVRRRCGRGAHSLRRHAARHPGRARPRRGPRPGPARGAARFAGRVGPPGPRRWRTSTAEASVDHTLWAYPWDVVDDPGAADEIAALGLGRVSLAATYHATRTLLPHNPRRKVLSARHAAAYFEPDPSALRWPPAATLHARLGRRRLVRRSPRFASGTRAARQRVGRDPAQLASR